MTTPRTAASSDARKRLAEAGASESLAPVLPDTSGWVQRVPGDVIEAGTPYVYLSSDGLILTHRATGLDLSFPVPDGPTYWTPPPVPREPWHDLSTDREKPTDAYVNGVPGRYYRWDGYVLALDPVDRDRETVKESEVTSVELLSTHDPVTQVPVDRALIDEAARCSNGHASRDAHLIVRSLAALADAAVSKDADQ